MNTKNKLLDDLTVICGIAQTRQEWFRDRLGVRTYQDLSALVPERVVAQLKADGHIVSLAKVISWCADAKNLAGKQSSVNPNDWNPVASFVVEFQVRQGDNGSEEWCTAVEPMESNGEEKWPGIETEQLCGWMREWLNRQVLKKDPPPTAPAPKPSMVPSLVMNQIRVYQPPYSTEASAWSAANKSFTGFVERDQTFDLRVDLSIDNCDLGELENLGVQGIAQFFSRSVPGGQIIPIGKPVPFPLQAGKNDYIVVLPDITLPAGTYHLKVLVKLMISPPISLYQEAKFLLVD